MGESVSVELLLTVVGGIVLLLEALVGVGVDIKYTVVGASVEG